MELRIVDFEKLSRHYKRYQDGLEVIEFHKKKYIDLIDPIKKEMSSIIASHQSGLVIDSRSQKERAERFQKLQEDIMSIDKTATSELTEIRDKMTKEVYGDLEKIITEWSIENSIDLVMGKIECVYVSEKNEITNQILEVLKSMDVYVEYIEEEKSEELEEEKESV